MKVFCGWFYIIYLFDTVYEFVKDGCCLVPIEKLAMQTKVFPVPATIQTGYKT